MRLGIFSLFLGLVGALVGLVSCIFLRTSGVPTERPGYNLAWPSEDFSHPSYRPDNVRIQVNAEIAPDGAKIATRLIETGSAGFHRVEVTIGGVQIGGRHTASLFVKQAEENSNLLTARDIIFEMRDNPTGNYGFAHFDLDAMRVVSNYGNVVSSGVKLAENGWVRVWATMTFITNEAVVDFDMSEPDEGGNYTGDEKSGLLVWGLQFEPSSTVNPYVTTKTGPQGTGE